MSVMLDTICDMLIGMLEKNVISPLSAARKHASKEKKYYKTIFPLTFGTTKNVNPSSML